MGKAIEWVMKRCPFCASKKARIESVRNYNNRHGAYSQFLVQCPCGASGPMKYSREKAVELWNKRKEMQGDKSSETELEK
jgi:Lar family restriction alleviation protein